MPDPRFFEDMGPVTLSALADLCGAQLQHPDQGGRRIVSAGPLTRVGPGDISFFADKRYRDDLSQSKAGACFITPGHAELAPPGCTLLITPEPHAAYARAAERLHRPRHFTAGDPCIHPTAMLEPGVILAPGVVIGAAAQVGSGTQIGAYTVIGPGVAIGRHCVIASHVTLGFALLGDRVKILAGAIIGEPGFGVTTSAGGAIDIPQLGRVIIQDGVTIGSGTCIDRGAWDDTVIGENTKIDNLVQIAHNVRIGRNCMMAAQSGISGSVVIGDGVAFGGRAGIADHINVGDGARIAAAAGVMKDVPAGEMWVGTPARPIRRFMRETAWLAKMARNRDEASES
jgi:UDP-3-O-[3-hydroxymyristoyl] glucosamine N-acyltransferase